jgi:sulfonate transport system permease protein
LDLVMAAIVVVGIVGLAIDRGVGAIEARLLRWRPVSRFQHEAEAAL